MALVIPGCGGGSEASSPAAKEAFIKRADAICTKTDGRQEAAQKAFLKKYPEATGTKLWEEKIALEAALPPVKVEAKELASLAAPSGDAGEIEAIVSSLEEAVKEGEAEPSVMLTKGPGPFAKLERLARDYGFKACALPL